MMLQFLNGLQLCTTRESKGSVKLSCLHVYIGDIVTLPQANLLADGNMKTKQFESQHLGVARKFHTKDMGSAVVRVAAKKLVARSLQLHTVYMLGFC